MVRTTTHDPVIQKGIDAVYALNADTVLREKIRQRDKAIRDYYNDMATARLEGRLEGQLGTLAGLVKDGILSIAVAAERSNMTVPEFEAKTGIKA